MKQLLILFAGLISVFALATVQANTPPDASTAGVNHTRGAENQHSSFTVKDYGQDEGPDAVDTGNISYQNFTSGDQYNANVVCVRVFNGNQARFAFEVPPGNPDSGFWKVYAVKDGGEPGTNGDELGIDFEPNQSIACFAVNNPTAFPIPPTETITAGNIQVHG